MTDVKDRTGPNLSPSVSPGLSEQDARRDMELLFYAYRDFTAEADMVLARHGLGRAHHRALYFIGRNPAITVSELLSILRITKQSLARVLNDLVRLGFVVQRTGLEDRRRRHLELTANGAELERHLMDRQRARILRAYRDGGAEAVDGFRRVLTGIVNEHDRARLGDPPRDAAR
jgi:DNA-binding MarR family transcriptional regulator